MYKFWYLHNTRRSERSGDGLYHLDATSFSQNCKIDGPLGIYDPKLKVNMFAMKFEEVRGNPTFVAGGSDVPTKTF